MPSALLGPVPPGGVGVVDGPVDGVLDGSVDGGSARAGSGAGGRLAGGSSAAHPALSAPASSSAASSRRPTPTSLGLEDRPVPGQRDPERRTDAELAVDVDPAAVARDDPRHDRQPEPGARPAQRLGVGRAEEVGEEQVAGRRRRSRGPRRCTRRRPRRRGPRGRAALRRRRRSTSRRSEQVAQHAAQLVGGPRPRTGTGARTPAARPARRPARMATSSTTSPSSATEGDTAAGRGSGWVSTRVSSSRSSAREVSRPALRPARRATGRACSGRSGDHPGSRRARVMTPSGLLQLVGDGGDQRRAVVVEAVSSSMSCCSRSWARVLRSARPRSWPTPRAADALALGPAVARARRGRATSITPIDSGPAPTGASSSSPAPWSARWRASVGPVGASSRRRPRHLAGLGDDDGAGRATRAWRRPRRRGAAVRQHGCRRPHAGAAHSGGGR